MAEIGADFRGGWYGDQTEAGGGGYDPLSSVQASGPLAKLYNSGTYDFTNRYYPRNLGTSTRGHYINFYVNVAKRSQYLADGAYKLALNSKGQGSAGVAGYHQQQQGYLAIPIAPGDSLSFSRQTKRITTAISLYMPDTMNVQYANDWESSSLTDAGGKLLQTTQGINSAVDNLAYSASQIASNPALAEAVGNAFGGGDTTSFLLASGGTALNPQLEVLFKGTGMREFQFDFLFTPYSEEEAKNVREIIHTFKFHAAPELLTNESGGGHGRYFVPPSEFDIDFLFNGQINTKIHKVSTCVLKNVNVDYAPNGWSTLSNGTPTSTRLTLQFQEVEIMTKNRISEGY